jgi:hypothetical protein
MDAPEIKVGGVYSSKQDDGSFRVVKVLAFEGGTVHLRLFAEKFTQPPNIASSAPLSLGSLKGGAVGIGHYPVSIAGFSRGEKSLLFEEAISEDELEGFRIWQEEQE